MTPPPQPFRLVYRAFERVEFDPVKSEEVLETRGFDLGFVSRIFPGYVLEREDTRGHAEPRFQVIGELLGEVYEIIYTRRGRACRLITAWVAEPAYQGMWGMTDEAERTVVVDQTDPNRGRYDPSRVGKYNPLDTEPRPLIPPGDIEATRAELAELRRRMTRRTA